MVKILTFDSIYILKPLSILYTSLIRKILNSKKTTNIRLVLCRLDKDNIFLRDYRNISGINVGLHQDDIDAISIKFYRYLNKNGKYDALSINDVSLYQLYPRQVKLKLANVLRCALRIRNLSNHNEQNIEILADRQTLSIMKEAFLFLNFSPSNITWKANVFLTSCITINSLIMRIVALVKMYISSSKLPNVYFYNFIDPNLPTVLITLPKERPDDFFSTYVEEFNNQYNIVLYSMGFFKIDPKNYKKIEIKKSTSFLRGIFKLKNVFWSADSYIFDILLIFKNHEDLIRAASVVNSIFSKPIHAHVSRQQTNSVETYLAVEARRRGIFILGDIMEEIFYCDSAICSSRSENTESVKLALANGGKVAYKGNNSLINYRINNFSDKKDNYLHKLLGLNSQKKIIFYASDPSKEESQRYLTEKFLIDFFSGQSKFVLVIKTHRQDNGRVTNYAYLDSEKPSNVFLIGDTRHSGKIVSEQFSLFDDFDFNAAITSSNGFLTFSSSSILEALTLGVKTGIVDKFNNGFYDYLIAYKATMLINNEESLLHFLKAPKLDISDEALSYCGLKITNEEFDIGAHLFKSMAEFDSNNENKQPYG